MIKKELFDRYGLFDYKFKVCEDYELWLRIASKIKIGYLDIRGRVRLLGILGNMWLFISGLIKKSWCRLVSFRLRYPTYYYDPLEVKLVECRCVPGAKCRRVS